jgi:cation diffusion facilitator family transporter
MTDTKQTTRKVRVALLSVISNITLVTGKIVVGLITGSVSIISEAIHSGVDLLAALIAFVSVATSGKPADHEHQFGHGKYENISGAIEAILIFIAAIWIFYESIHKLIYPKPLDMAGLGVAVMLVSALMNVIVSGMLFKVGRETDSIALTADAWHLRTDVYTSVGVMFGLAVIWVGKLITPRIDLAWVDPVAAIFVAILITRAAWHLTADSVKDLLDVSLSSDEEELIRNHIRAESAKIRGFHGLRTRKAGPYRFVEFHLIVDPEMSVNESHLISEKLEAAIAEHYPGTNTTIHIEPCDGSCKPDCREGCLTPEKQQK